jgi:hypothetical protein
MSSINTLQLPSHRTNRHFITSLVTFIAAFIVSFIPLLGFYDYSCARLRLRLQRV